MTKLFALFLLTFPLMTHAQGFYLSGKISFPDGNAAPSVTIIAYDKADHLTNYTHTDELGAFSILIDGTRDKYISISHVGYARSLISLDSLVPAKTPGKKIHVVLRPEPKELQEVIVREENVERDTISLNLKNLNLQENTLLGDILKRIPSFRVDDNGVILYKGKTIEKIMVNGKPAFDHQNTIALKSIEKRLIENISIINNARNNFILDFDQQDESVLNIDTKAKYKNILLGSVLAGLGYNRKYNILAKSLLFSKNINAFAVSGSNNIGEIAVDLPELGNFFSTQQPFSSYQKTAINDLLRKDENRTKDAVSSNNITLRTEHRTYRINAIVYYFNASRISGTNQNLITSDGTNLLSSQNWLSASGNCLFAKLEASKKLNNDHILNYQLSLTNDHNNSSLNSQEQIFTNNSQNTLYAYQRNQLTSLFNTLTLSSRINRKLISDATISSYRENTEFPNTGILDSNSNTTLFRQNLEYNKQNITGSETLNYKYADFLISSLKVDLSSTKESQNPDSAFKNPPLKRNINNLSLQSGVSGQKIGEKFSYQAQLEYRNLNTTVNSNKSGKQFTPWLLDLAYENRLTRWELSFKKRITPSDLESGTTVIRSFNQIVVGSDSFPSRFSVTGDLRLSYAYNNLFRGISHSLSIDYEEASNKLKQGIDSIDQNGMQWFNLYAIPQSYTLTFDGYTSRIISKYHFPIKGELELKYSIFNDPSYYASAKIPLNNDELYANLKWVSLTRSNFNIENESSFTNSITTTTSYSYIARYLSNTSTLKYTKGKMEARLSFVYNNNNVMGKTYQRRNFNLDFSYNWKKIFVGLEGRNVDDIFGLFNNRAYNTIVNYGNGLNTVLIRNAALNYAILTIKYNFNP